jgi:hypothetical protein
VPIGSGLDGQLGIGIESVVGTLVTPTDFYEINSESLAPNPVAFESTPITGGLVMRSGRRRVRQAGGGGGSFDVNVLNKGMGDLLKACFGTVVTAQVGATTEYTHTYTLDTASGQRGQSYSVQVGRPAAETATVHPFNFAGGKVTGFRFNNPLNEGLTLSTDWDFMSHETTTALATDTYPASAFPFTAMDGAVTLGGSAIATVSSFSFGVAKSMATDRFNMGGTKRQPLANAIWRVTGELTAEFESLTAYAAYLAGTEETNLVVTYSFGTITGASNPYKLIFTFPLIQRTGSAPQLSGPGIVGQNMPFEALHNGTDAIVTAVYHTSDTTV